MTETGKKYNKPTGTTTTTTAPIAAHRMTTKHAPGWPRAAACGADPQRGKGWVEGDKK